MPHQSARRKRARVADPSTPEASIAKLGIRTVAELDAAMARTPKGQVLLGALFDFFADADAGLGLDSYIVDLIAEPALTSQHLATATTVMHRRHGPAYARLAAAICTYPLASPHAIIGALWNASPPLHQDIARTRADLLPVAVCWVRHTAGDDTGYANQAAMITDTARTWAHWAGDSPARTAFLIASSAAFTDQDALLAAGDAVPAPAART